MYLRRLIQFDIINAMLFIQLMGINCENILHFHNNTTKTKEKSCTTNLVPVIGKQQKTKETSCTTNFVSVTKTKEESLSTNPVYHQIGYF